MSNLPERDGDTLSDERIAGIKARLEAATPGPWKKGRDDLDSYHTDGEQFANVYSDGVRTGKMHLGHELPCVVAEARGADPHADARFIAHARQDVPWLLDTVAALRAGVAALRRQQNEVVKACDTGLRLSLPAEQIVARIRAARSASGEDRHGD